MYRSVQRLTDCNYRHPMHIQFNPKKSFILSLFLTGLIFSACDNTIQPFEEEETLFSVYGSFELTDSTHYIRIKDTNKPLIPDSTKELDAEVTLENTANGNHFELEKQTEQMGELYAHNFPVYKEVQPSTEYRLTIENPEGKKAVTYATTPPFSEAESPHIDEFCTTEVEVQFPDAEKPERISSSVGFKYLGEFHWLTYHPETNADGEVSITFEPQGLINIKFMDEFDFTMDPYENPPVLCNELDEDFFRVEFRHFGPEWDGYSTPVSPLESVDVKHGIGFFGAYYDNYFDLPLDTTHVY